MKYWIEEVSEESDLQTHDGLGGYNFLVSSIFNLRRQRNDLSKEVAELKERVRMLEQQSASFINVSADRLLKISE